MKDSKRDTPNALLKSMKKNVNNRNKQLFKDVILKVVFQRRIDDILNRSP